VHAADRSIDLAVLIAGEIHMTILNTVSSSSTSSSSTWRHPAITTLVFAALGFVLGFLLSLAVAAQSLYVCTEVM
jgi:uncharacterized protein YacL